MRYLFAAALRNGFLCARTHIHATFKSSHVTGTASCVIMFANVLHKFALNCLCLCRHWLCTACVCACVCVCSPVRDFRVGLQTAPCMWCNEKKQLGSSYMGVIYPHIEWYSRNISNYSGDMPIYTRDTRETKCQKYAASKCHNILAHIPSESELYPDSWNVWRTLLNSGSIFAGETV